MIEVNDVTKRYGETIAVDHLSFTVKPGIVTGFLGPNGAGKTTTMRMILGLDSPSSGTVTVNGRATNRLRAQNRFVACLPLGSTSAWRASSFPLARIDPGVVADGPSDRCSW
jgi:ABC-2 type transport system ATP-binding protein